MWETNVYNVLKQVALVVAISVIDLPKSFEPIPREKNVVVHSIFHYDQRTWYNRTLMVYTKLFRSSPPDVFLGEGVLKICSKLKGEHPCPSAISIKLQGNFIEITFGYGC